MNVHQDRYPHLQKLQKRHERDQLKKLSVMYVGLTCDLLWNVETLKAAPEMLKLLGQSVLRERLAAKLCGWTYIDALCAYAVGDATLEDLQEQYRGMLEGP